MRKCNLFIVGAAKSATTTAFDVLSKHPDIHPADIKETHYFATDVDHKIFLQIPPEHETVMLGAAKDSLIQSRQALIRKEEDYQGLFRDCGDCPYLMDASVSYLFSDEAPANIYDYNPDSRILIILRNPVDRAFSHYQMLFSRGYAGVSFMQELQRRENVTRSGSVKNMLLDLGLYHAQCARYMDTFPDGAVHILLMEELIDDARVTYDGVTDFLGLDPLPEDVDLGMHSNIAKHPRNRMALSVLRSRHLRNFYRRTIKGDLFDTLIQRLLTKRGTRCSMSDEEKRYLQEYFREDVTKLEGLLGRQLENWPT